MIDSVSERCVICGSAFVKVNAAKTCGETCSKLLKRKTSAARCRKYSAAHPERKRASNQEYHAANRERICADHRRRYAARVAALAPVIHQFRDALEKKREDAREENSPFEELTPEEIGRRAAQVRAERDPNRRLWTR